MKKEPFIKIKCEKRSFVPQVEKEKTKIQNHLYRKLKVKSVTERQISEIQRIEKCRMWFCELYVTWKLVGNYKSSYYLPWLKKDKKWEDQKENTSNLTKERK